MVLPLRPPLSQKVQNHPEQRQKKAKKQKQGDETLQLSPGCNGPPAWGERKERSCFEVRKINVGMWWGEQNKCRIVRMWELVSFYPIQ